MTKPNPLWTAFMSSVCLSAKVPTKHVGALIEALRSMPHVSESVECAWCGGFPDASPHKEISDCGCRNPQEHHAFVRQERIEILLTADYDVSRETLTPEVE